METKFTALTPPSPMSKSLYSMGVDVTIGPSGSAISTAPYTTLLQSAEVSSSQGSPSQSPAMSFKQDYSIGGLDIEPRIDDRRRKSVVKPHPKATARNGQSFAMGSSIGAHSGERRRSSAPRVQRVRTIDNVHKGEHDQPPSRWRAPSVCPPRLSVGQLSINPVEPEDSRDERSYDRIPEILTRLSRLRSGITDRMTLVEAKSPPLPKSDCAGIYGTITGTLRRSIGAPCQEDASQHTCDDCANSSRTPSIDWIG
ncbi:hypothetical protein VTL71DRAFT_5874 [Oculimacula yallundae]|uniref:Uncharacterized protein n=1 Tax=Oculimacula yallundae TaxID=86028 RepID=A0ABR4BZG2_9HELO